MGNPEIRLRRERVALLRLAIEACDPDDAVPILARALEDLRPGTPPAAFANILREAESWAAFATAPELKAYLLATFHALPPRDQLAFLRHLHRGMAA